MRGVCGDLRPSRVAGFWSNPLIAGLLLARMVCGRAGDAAEGTAVVAAIWLVAGLIAATSY